MSISTSIFSRFRRNVLYAGIATIAVAGAAIASPAMGEFTQRYPNRAPDGGRGRMFVKKGTSLTKPKITDSRHAPRLSTASRNSVTGQSEATLFGCMIGNDNWGYYDKPIGIYSINPNTGEVSKTIDATLLDEGQPAGTYVNGKMHISLSEDFYGYIYFVKNITIDCETGEIATYEVPEPTYSDISVNMTYDQINNVIYSINYGSTVNDYNLCTFDPQSNSYTVLAPLDNHYWGICVDANSNMYCINDDGEVVGIDKTTGHETGKLASTNFVPNMLQSCCWSPTDNRIYWAACNYSGGELIAIDPVTGLSETLCQFDGGAEFIGLYCTDPVTKAKAPAACTGLKVDYAAPGSTTATISCHLPSTTFDGSVLEAPVTFTINIDGSELYTTTELQPGAQFSKEFELSSGMHRIEAVCSNNEGKGQPTSLSTFTGIDTPAAPATFTVDIEDDTSINLAWDAVTTGTNGGWIDDALISYSIQRNGATVAENITSTTYTDIVPDLIEVYTYTVAVNYDDVEYVKSAPVTVTAGKYIQLPYSNDFSKADSFSLLTVVDGNEDGTTWVYEDDRAAAAYNHSRYQQANDFLVLPRVKMEKDHMYAVSFTARSVSGSYPEKAGIVWGKEATADALTTVVTEAVTIPDDFTKHEGIYRAAEDGLGYFAVHCVSDADMSTLYVNGATIADLGHVDAPQASTGLKAECVNDRTVEVSFKLPTLNNSGQPLAAISKAEVLRNGKPIHTFNAPTLGSELSITDEADFGFNTYTVVAYAGELRGVDANVKVFAGTYTLPFSVEPNADEYTLFTAETNADSYDNEWYFDISANALKISTYGSNDTDQYIFSPVVELGTANLIDLSFDACVGLAYDTEVLEVTYGREPSRDAQTAIKTFEFNNTDFATQTVTFEIPAPGRYYIGFHAISPARRTCLSVKNIKLENGALKRAPAAPADVVATAGAQGALTVDVDFTVPATNLNGEPLAEGSTVDVVLTRADGTEAAKLEALTPGAKTTISDGNSMAGICNYTLTAYNSYGRGGVADVSAWCGVDIPTQVEDLDVHVTPDNMAAVLSWSAPTGSVHGGWVDPDGITYRIYQLVNGKDLYKIAETKETTYTAYPDDGILDFYYYYVSASTSAGEGISSYTGVMAGAPATLPMVETASNRIITNLPWISGSLEGDVNWGVADYIGSLDLAATDGGMFVCSSALPYRAPGAARMQLPKLTFNGLNAPTLKFKMYHYNVSGSELNVSITTDEKEYNTVLSVQNDEMADGWHTYSINLADYRYAPWVAIVFDGILDNGASYVIVDDISVANESEYDLALGTVSGRSVLEVGETGAYLVEVKNMGRQNASFELNMKANGNLIGSVKRESQLPSGSSDIYRFEFTPTAENIASPVEMSLEIVPDGWTDEIPGNNHGEFTVSVVQPELPVVTDLTATQTDGNVGLAWSAPSLVPAPFTDTFEDYESFSYENIGDYTLYDGDGLTPCGIMNVKFPNMGTPMAFQVWEPLAEGVDVTIDLWAPRSGKKCLVAWTSLSQTEEPYNDDWLISPALEVMESGQKLSFYAKRPVSDYGPETFEVLYSTTGTNINDFTLIKREVVNIGGWKEYTYELPAGARHFAIRYVSSNKFAMLFDDLTFIPASKTSTLTINGYNVYRNNAKVANVTGTAFNEPVSDTNAAYNVTVVYNGGESHKSNTVYLTSGFGDVNAAAISVNARKGHITVDNAAGRVITITAVNGMTVAVSDSHTDKAEFNVAPAIYMVKVEGIGAAKVLAQ